MTPASLPESAKSDSLPESLPKDDANPTGHPAPSEACKTAVKAAHAERSNVSDLDAERLKRAKAKAKAKKKAPREKVRITKDNWATLEPEIKGQKDIIHCDYKHGFCLVIYPSGERSFGMVFTVENGERRTRTLGKCKQTPIGAAHARMDRIVRDAIANGTDVSRRVQKRMNSAALRLRAAHAEYVKIHSNPALDEPLSAGSIQRYGFAVQSLMEALGGDVLFFDISRKDCITAHEYLSDPEKQGHPPSDGALITREACLEYLKTSTAPARKSKPRHRKGSLTTANYALLYLEILWAQHSKQFEQARTCPVVAVEDRMKKPKSREGIIKPEDIASYWEAVASITREKGLEDTGAVWTLYFWMLVLTGRRRTELLKLQWAFVDLKRAFYTIVTGDAKNRKEVTFPMGRWLTAQLRKLRATQAESTEWVWAYPENTRLSGQRLSKPDEVLKQIRQVPLFANFKMHDARRTFSTLAVSPAVETPLLTQHKMLNHHIKDQTGEYSKISADMMRPYTQRIENVILALTQVRTKDEALDIILTKREDK